MKFDVELSNVSSVRLLFTELPVPSSVKFQCITLGLLLSSGITICDRLCVTPPELG